MEETWVKIPDFPKYEISSHGNIRTHRGIIKRFDQAGRTRWKYRSVKLYVAPRKYKHLVVHKLMWISFYGPVPDGFCIDHIDRNRENNVLSNLRCIAFRDNELNKDRYDEECPF